MVTPIEKARNLGPVTQAELGACNIHSLEQLREIGWEDACIRWVEAFPERLNLNAFYAVIGAIEDIDWRNLPPVLKAEAKRLRRQLGSQSSK